MSAYEPDALIVAGGGSIAAATAARGVRGFGHRPPRSLRSSRSPW